MKSLCICESDDINSDILFLKSDMAANKAAIRKEPRREAVIDLGAESRSQIGAIIRAGGDWLVPAWMTERGTTEQRVARGLTLTHTMLRRRAPALKRLTVSVQNDALMTLFF